LCLKAHRSRNILGWVIPNPAQFSRVRDLAWSFDGRTTGAAREIAADQSVSKLKLVPRA